MTINEHPLKNELCFQLYVASKEIIRAYKPFLDNYHLTYTGFIALRAIYDGISVKQLGEYLFLDSGTLSPLLKKLEKQGLIQRTRANQDERQLVIELTETGLALQKELPCISKKVHDSVTKDIAHPNYSSLIQQLIELNQLFRMN